MMKTLMMKALLMITTFPRNSKFLIAIPKHENYRRGIVIFEQAIATLSNELKNAQQFIAQLQAEKGTTTDPKRLKQIEIDIAYVQDAINRLQPDMLIKQYSEKLAAHKEEYQKSSNRLTNNNSPINK